MRQDLKNFPSTSSLRGRSSLYVQVWWIVQATLFGCSPQFMYGWRRFLLRSFGAKVGNGAIVRPTARVTFPWKLTLGENCWIGDEVRLYNWETISIGDNAVVSQSSYVCTASHDWNDKYFPLTAKAVSVGTEAWVATDVFIAPGVTIGDGAVVGARSSVFSDLPSDMVCYGCPAKPVYPREVS